MNESDRDSGSVPLKKYQHLEFVEMQLLQILCV